MRLSISLIFVFLSIVSLGFSQLPTASNLTDDKGKRQGDWVIYYDQLLVKVFLISCAID